MYCKWTKGCVGPGPWLAYINGAWRECTEPDKASEQGVELYCVGHAREFQRLKVRNTTDLITKDGERRVYDNRANPLLLFPRRLIEKAIDDGKTVDPAGMPTDEAIEAKDWLERPGDISDPGTFEWCCHWLDLDIEQTRRNALSEINNSEGWRHARRVKGLMEQRQQTVARRREESEAQLAMF